MCGVCGIVHHDVAHIVDQSALIRMRDSLIHRGPDDAGIYASGNIGLGSMRLSILDLSPNGHMPMSTSDQRFWIVHNGEVYNFQELRSTLQAQGINFRSHSDTEVLLYLYQRYGARMLDMCNGMFAFAIWDAQEKSLFIARDRMGVKPLYYAINTTGLYFASEEKALFAAGLQREFDENTAAELLYFRYIAGERTPYKGIQRLLPGHYLIYQNGKITLHSWYQLSDKIEPFKNRNRDEVQQEFNQLFDDSIRLRRISDVSIGSLLSGGLDSGAMTSTMALQAGSGVSSFTVRFADEKYDEGSYAKELAELRSLDYHELFLEQDDLPEMLRQATYFLDEPLMHGHDPHLLAISRLAKKNVKVLLSGEGADETLGGYVRYLLFRSPKWLMNTVGMFSNMLAKINLLPARMRKSVEILNFRNSTDRLVYSSAEMFPYQFKTKIPPNLEYRYKVAEDAQKIYSEPVRQIMYYEQHTYLQSLLDRNDRMTMGASIECREPFLDFRLVEWAANLPTKFLYEKGIGKAVLRKSMQKRLPSSILNHKKWGFGVPWHTYLRSNSVFRQKIQSLADGKLNTNLLNDLNVRKGAQAFLNGDDHFMPLVRQYIFFDIWQDVCL